MQSKETDVGTVGATISSVSTDDGPGATFHIGAACAHRLDLCLEYCDVGVAVRISVDPDFTHHRATSNPASTHNHAAIQSPSASTPMYTALSVHFPSPPISDEPQTSFRCSDRTLAPTNPTCRITSGNSTSFSTFDISSKSLPGSLDTPTSTARHDYNPRPPDTSTSSACACVFPDPESDEDVGIGLTLLQDLTDGGGSGA